MHKIIFITQVCRFFRHLSLKMFKFGEVFSKQLLFSLYLFCELVIMALLYSTM